MYGCLFLKLDQKKDSHRSAVFYEKVFYYGDSKKYIMYWGVFTVIIVSP